jgi:hypothetical protein
MAKFAFSDIGTGLSFVKKEEYNELTKDQTTLIATAVLRGPSTDFTGKPCEQWILVFDLDGESRARGWTVSDGSRDRILAALKDYFENDEEPEPTAVRFVLNGRYVTIELVEE